jgi:hypothetical protein
VNTTDNSVFSDQGTSVSKYQVSKTLPSAPVARIGQGTLVQGTGVAVDPARESVYVADVSAGLVYVFSPPTGPPQIGSVALTNVFGDEAVLSASIYTGQFDTKYRFEYGPTEAYGSTIPAQDADIGSGPREVSAEQTLTGLTPGVTYHYRVVASNSQGTVASADHVHHISRELRSAGRPRL